MTFKEHMFETLTELLEGNETLMYPIYGVLNQGNAQYYGYFGFTENCLLMALLSGTGKQIVYATRVPLEIQSLRVKQTAVFKQYVIDIGFREDAPCRITASPKVWNIDTQKENLPAFLARLTAIAPKTQQPVLKQLPGEKIRAQYFNYWIGFFLSFVPAVPIMISVLEWKKSGELPVAESLSGFGETLLLTVAIGGVFLVPFLLLSWLNRVCFGKVVCVADDKGLHIDSGVVPWEDIKSISFRTATHSRVRYRPSCATLSVKNYTVEIAHFPFYGLRKIKKHCPEVKITVQDKGWILFWALFPSLLAVSFSLLC